VTTEAEMEVYELNGADDVLAAPLIRSGNEALGHHLVYVVVIAVV
jgi:hypothetical protein